MFLPAFGTFPSVVSAFVMSHKSDLRPLLEKEQSKRLDKPTCASNRERQGSKVVGASKIWRILYWRQVVSALALIAFAQEGYYLLEVIPVTAIEASGRDILPGFG
jgi:hypothetical protein